MDPEVQQVQCFHLGLLVHLAHLDHLNQYLLLNLKVQMVLMGQWNLETLSLLWRLLDHLDHLDQKVQRDLLHQLLHPDQDHQLGLMVLYLLSVLFDLMDRMDLMGHLDQDLPCHHGLLLIQLAQLVLVVQDLQ